MRDLVKETPLTVAYLSKNTNETLQLCSKGEFLKLYITERLKSSLESKTHRQIEIFNSLSAVWPIFLI